MAIVTDFEMDGAETAGQVSYRIWREQCARGGMAIPRRNPYTAPLMRWAFDVGWRLGEHLTAMGVRR